ncbi:Fur family transcriptional regulator [Lentilactobacillus laojiaonis]|uniref:Fur family transcriptional regulator n=1 Tax=Lentilactobacillus laojiaonis TaxID=2883998 RepID=UPI001D0B5ADC|nr:Fur family transcriptional regulator [Lentilactobacillus laojiaonis]UDM32322.1 transcriptional repressor [Lentilactobacillus laojiaonis]
MPTLIDEATKILRDNKLKITKQRKAMLDYLANNAKHCYVDVTKIDEYMRKTFPRMSHNTIYRNIDEFTQLGLVERQAQGDQAAVCFQCDFKNEHHHHFVCNQCGKVIELENCPIDPKIMAQLGGCQISGHLFQIYGECADCVNSSI